MVFEGLSTRLDRLIVRFTTHTNVVVQRAHDCFMAPELDMFSRRIVEFKAGDKGDTISLSMSLEMILRVIAPRSVLIQKAMRD